MTMLPVFRESAASEKSKNQQADSVKRDGAGRKVFGAGQSISGRWRGCLR